MIDNINLIGEKALLNKGTSYDEALFILKLEIKHMSHLLAWTEQIRQTSNGTAVDICSVINARSGGCPEDCSFCSQSVHVSAGISTYPLLPIETIVEGARTAKSNGATRFCLATSGNGIGNKKELARICEAIERITEDIGINVCATLGSMAEDEMLALKSAGLSRFHHNLETSEEYFPNVCTTHTYQDRIGQVRLAKKVGLSICSGGIFGIGESIEDIVDIAFAIKELDVDSVPINFLMPFQGSPLECTKPVTPWDALKIIALFRILIPDREIRICGGRTTALRELHPFIFASGANGMMIGNYLTKGGREPNKDLRMLSDLGLEIATAISVI